MAGSGGVRAVGRVVSAVGNIPGVVAALPGQRALKGAEEVVQRPGNDDIVVCAHDERDGYSCQANSLKFKRGETSNKN